MLLSFRKRLIIALFPTHIVVVKTARRGLRGQCSQPQAFSIEQWPGEPIWHGSVIALRIWLEENKHVLPTDVEIIVSDSFSHYALIPWSDNTRRPVEIALLTQMCFDELYGSTAAAGWEVRVDMPEYGKAGIACALDKALIQALEELCLSYRLRLISIRTNFIDAHNRSHDRIGNNALIAVVDCDQCVLASKMDGSWHSVRSVRLGKYTGKELLMSIEREVLLQGLDEQFPVFLHAPETIDFSLLQKNSRVTILDTSCALARQMY